MKYIRTYESYHALIRESFAEKDFVRANKLIIDYLQKNLGIIYEYPGVEEFSDETSNSNKFLEKRWLLQNGSSFTLCWLKSDNSYSIVAIDIYLEKSNFDTPYKTFYPNGISIAQVLPQLAKFIKNPNIAIDFNSTKESMRSDIRIFEKNSIEPEIDTTREKEYVEPNIKDLPDDDDSIFARIEEMKGYVDLIISGDFTSLLLLGAPGLGKSFHVKKELKSHGLQKDSDFVFFKGKVTAASVFTSLYQYNGKLLIYDDCDSVLEDPDGINIFKGALDSDEDGREITWGTSTTLKYSDPSLLDIDVEDDDGDEYDADDNYDYDYGENPKKQKKKNKQKSDIVKVPHTFQFTGKAIFISNKKKKQIDSAIRSRANVFEIVAEASEIIDYMKSILYIIGEGESWFDKATKGMRDEVFDMMVTLSKTSNDIVLNPRLLGRILKIRASNIPIWKKMVRTQVLSSSN